MQTSPITNDKRNEQFYLIADGAKAFIDYRLEGDKYLLNHAEVPNALRGQGIGQVLVEKTYAEIEKEGKVAVARCPFVKRVAERMGKHSPDH